MQNISEQKLDRLIRESDIDEFSRELDRLTSSGKQFENLASSSMETESDMLKSSHLLYNPGFGGEMLMLNNFQPMRKGVDIKNDFSFEVLKEINMSLHMNSLFDGITRFRKWPTKLLTSNYESSENRIRGGQLLQFKDKLFAIVLDSKSDLLAQCFQAEQSNQVHSLRERNYKIKWQKFEWDDAEEEECLAYQRNYMIHKTKLEMSSLRKSEQVRDDESGTEQIMSVEHKETSGSIENCEI